jgi:hypothetical protein
MSWLYLAAFREISMTFYVAAVKIFPGKEPGIKAGLRVTIPVIVLFTPR